MPVFNEKRWLDKVAKKVLEQRIKGIREVEIVMVDDGSTDGTREIVQELGEQSKGKIISVFHEKNSGKGSAIHSAIEKMTGDICIIQDADLEYDPADYAFILEPLINGRADCVYGSRFVGKDSKRVLYYWHYLGNRFLTLMSNIFTNLNLTDMETCYKAFRCDLLKTIPFRCNRFGFEPEVTAKIAKRKFKIFEVGISYNGRTYEEGKKISWVDGVKAILVIIYFGIFADATKK